MTDQRRRLILFARFPVAGKVKTRLIPALGAEGAAVLHRRLVLRTLRTAHAFCQSQDVELEIRFDGGDENAMQHWLGDGWNFRPQGDGHLGQRMFRAFEDSFHEGSPATVIIGSDCPALTAGILAAAFDRLITAPSVFGPADDGGYYLIGLVRSVPELFRGLAWGAETLLAESLRVLERVGVNPALLNPLGDLDRPADLPAWKHIIETEESDLQKVTVVIPTLNEAEQITATIASAREGKPREIFVVDGGSTDKTVQYAREAGATVIVSARGRARQMNAGAAHATGNTLLFLHADTLLPGNYLSAVSGTLRRPNVGAGAFRFKIDRNFNGKWILERTVNLRSRWCQMPYGDQALFLRRSVFEEIGSFADMPIMEDYEFVRRLRCHGRVVTVNQKVLTSGRRWQRLGFMRTTFINWRMLAGYHAGWPIGKLERIYRDT